jgi:hypothetical protein
MPMDKNAMLMDLRLRKYPSTANPIAATMNPMIRIHALLGHLTHSPDRR